MHDQSEFGAGKSESSPHSRPGAAETKLNVRWLRVESKWFTLALCENPRGTFLRVTEEGRTRRNHILIPASGLETFLDVITRMADASASLPALDDELRGSSDFQAE